jgi:hypothetical protein
MQIHVTLIPISHSDQPPPSLDPPESIYHYTTGLKLRSIINSGHIKPTTAKIELHEKPVAWFSTQDQWEPTCTKVPVPGMQGQIMTAQAQGGLVRITVPGTSAPYIFPQLPLIAGTKPSVCIGLPLRLFRLPCSAWWCSTTSRTTGGWPSIWPNSPAATDCVFPSPPPSPQGDAT